MTKPSGTPGPEESRPGRDDGGTTPTSPPQGPDAVTEFLSSVLQLQKAAKDVRPRPEQEIWAEVARDNEATDNYQRLMMTKIWPRVLLSGPFPVSVGMIVWNPDHGRYLGFSIIVFVCSSVILALIGWPLFRRRSRVAPEVRPDSPKPKSKKRKRKSNSKRKPKNAAKGSAKDSAPRRPS